MHLLGAVLAVLSAATFALFAFAPAARADDADTLTIGGIVYRLDGIDAPELDQNCLDEIGEVYPCGQLAVEALKRFIAGRPIHCDDLGPDPKYPKRRIGQCMVGGIDLHRWLVIEGWALNFEPYARGPFRDQEADARHGRFNIWKGCFVSPRDFRRWNKHKAVLLGPSCPSDALGYDNLVMKAQERCRGNRLTFHPIAQVWLWRPLHRIQLLAHTTSWPQPNQRSVLVY